MIQNKEILVVGAGPVGLAAAIEIKRLGGIPRIIDSNGAPNPNSRALAINPRTLDLLGPSGAAEKLLAAGLKTRKLVVRRDEKIIAQLDLSIIPHKYNFLLALAQHETETILVQTLAQMGVQVERNLGLVSLDMAPKPNATLSNGEIYLPDFIIGADGAHSIVRKSLGINFIGETDEDQFGLADVTLENWPFDFQTVVLTVMDDHIAPFLPLGENFGRMITTKTDCLHNLPKDAVVKNVAWETDFKISYRQAETYQKQNVFIVGDAAHIHSPVGGRGMNLGIEDACWLAWLIEQARENEFTTLRHTVGAEVLKFTHAFTRFAKARGFWQDLAIIIGMPILARLPFAQRRLFHNLTAQDTPPPPWL
ncbi:MAG: FAD-dependent monooxygenase [Aestuariivirga sp.]